MKLVILDGHAVNPGDLSWKCLEQFGEVIVYDRTDSADTVAHIGDAEIILVNKTLLTEEIFAACPSIRAVFVLATGYNVVDCQAAARRKIPVCNVPGYGTAAVAQFTFALLLELCHQVGQHNCAVHAGKWTSCNHFCYWETSQMELAGKTMGIIGFGRIGQAVGRIAKAFGMNVIAYSRTEYPEGQQIAEYVPLNVLLRRSDVISLHCPLFPETEGIINADTLSMTKDGVIILNTARGQLINEQDLAQALSGGKVRGAAMDVVSTEPIQPDNPLLSAPNCIITSHMAWAPIESRQRIIDMTVAAIAGFLEGKPIHVVNL